MQMYALLRALHMHFLCHQLLPRVSHGLSRCTAINSCHVSHMAYHCALPSTRATCLTWPATVHCHQLVPRISHGQDVPVEVAGENGCNLRCAAVHGPRGEERVEGEQGGPWDGEREREECCRRDGREKEDSDWWMGGREGGRMGKDEETCVRGRKEG